MSYCSDCGEKRNKVIKENTGEDVEMEGIVARPIETLFDKRMNRVIIKIKSVDFRHI